MSIDTIGSLSVSQSGTWTVQPGNTANTTPWLVAGYDQAAAIYNGSTSLTITYTPIAAATSGDNTLLAGTSAKKTYVLAMALVASAAVNLYIKDGTSGTVIFGGSTNKVQLAANGGFVLPYNPIGWFANATTNQALVMNLSGAVAVSGTLVTVTF